jgi:hypothetical protein
VVLRIFNYRLINVSGAPPKIVCEEEKEERRRDRSHVDLSFCSRHSYRHWRHPVCASKRSVTCHLVFDRTIPHFIFNNSYYKSFFYRLSSGSTLKIKPQVSKRNICDRLHRSCSKRLRTRRLPAYPSLAINKRLLHNLGNTNNTLASIPIEVSRRWHLAMATGPSPRTTLWPTQ